jgi:hypothetical protein
MRSTDGANDAPSTGRGRWLERRLVGEPELLRLDCELERVGDGRWSWAVGNEADLASWRLPALSSRRDLHDLAFELTS